jgi:hypothetical protein
MAIPCFPVRPKASPDAVVSIGHYRITVLTSRCLRIEFHTADHFLDSPTLTFVDREQPVPPKAVTRTDSGLELTTDHLRLTLTSPMSPPTPNSLTISSLTASFAWSFGTREARNLLGTARTLDSQAGPAHLSEGLISLDGFSIVDDTNAPVLCENGLFAPNPSELDLYFFGYGRAYGDCIRDFLRLSGAPPLLPRFAFGTWWSRWWEYRSEEVIALVRDFQAHGVPLSGFVLDMDWHVTETGNASEGWTGYTFNRRLIPDPAALFRELHALGVAVTLNLHPADGVWPHEAAYAEMARRRGVRPPSPVSFDCTNPGFMADYFELLHHPLEAAGVDFWWVDWQHGTGDTVDPLAVLNHRHFVDAGRDARRPLILSRWCGLGGQRYPIGFSGDTIVEWESLQLQPFFSATAANVGFGFWSHDMGGFFAGHESGELFVRWLQFGAWNPILRIHSHKNRFHDRRPWSFPPEIEARTCEALKLHTRLIPFMYSLAYHCHAECVTPIRPLYYLCPNDEPAYNCPAAYALGDDIVVAPFITPIDPATGVATTAVWLPLGSAWFDFQTGREYGGGWHLVSGGLARTPVFVKGGGFVPMDIDGVLTVHVFPKGSSRFELYEDDGISSDGPSHITTFISKFDPEAAEPFVLEMQSKGDRAAIQFQQPVVLNIHNISGDANATLRNCEIVDRDTKSGCLALTVRVTDYPATIGLSRESHFLIDRTRLSRAQLFALVQRTSLHSWVKQIIFDKLQRLQPHECATAIATDSSLSAPVKELLFGEICGLGCYRFTKSMGKDVIVVWNETNCPFTFHLSFRDLRNAQNSRHGSGVVPPSLIFEHEALVKEVDAHCPEQAIRSSRVVLRVDALPVFCQVFDQS